MTVSLFIAAGLFLLLGLRKLYRKHIRRGLGFLFLALICLLTGLILKQIALQVESYSAIHDEQDVAEVDLRDAKAVIISDLINQRNYRWLPKGDDWYLELRILRLKGICKKLLDWPDLYRLSRFKATEDTDGVSAILHSVKLHQANHGIDIWKKVRDLEESRPDLVEDIQTCIEADVVTSTAEKLSDKRRYRFSFRQSGLHQRVLPDPKPH